MKKDTLPEQKNKNLPLNPKLNQEISIFSSMQNLFGVAASLEKLLSKLVGGNKIVDLLYHQPCQINPKKFLPLLHQIKQKELIITQVKVESYIKPSKSQQPFRVRCFCSSGYLTLVFFKTFPNYIEKYFAIGSEIAVSGLAERFNDELIMSHPEYVFAANDINKIPKNDIIYPSIAGLNQKLIRNKITLALKTIENSAFMTEQNDWIDHKLLQQKGWPNWKEAIFALHNPKNLENSEHSLARKRLAFDELLASQIANQIAKKYLKTKNGNVLVAKNHLREKLLNALPFQLTSGQKEILQEIDQDLASEKKMIRLLQGDVGSGKTIVALLAMLTAVENNKQALIICPITLLAIQHHKSFQTLLESLGIKIALLTSKITKKNKQKILEDLKNGKINILVGTHSIIEPEVVFNDLALIVIDEQHRFGVMQRMKLVQKGNEANVLLMSATPIPRSLMLTFYGDIDISILKEKPQNRCKIDTRIISIAKEQEVLQSIERALKIGEKIYWICPLIAENVNEEDQNQTNLTIPNQDLSNVKQRFQQFVEQFGVEIVGLIHGKMKEKEKEQVMQNFNSGSNKILVATTVIEVGIDVTDATIIVIENCENFGLSQLHQLRGRVGRSDKKSYCILLYGKKIGQNGKKRLNIMKSSNDGFFIAEEDLKIRGSGEFIGTKQSGMPQYKIANLDFDLDLLEISNQQSQFLLSKTPINKAGLKNLLKIFNYDECWKLIFGG